MAKKKKNSELRVVVSSTPTQKRSFLANGCRTLKQLFAPSGIKIPSENELKIDENYARGFVINQYPASTMTGWLEDLYEYKEDMDIAIYIEPREQKESLNELTHKLSQFQAQLDIEIKSGSIKNLTELEAKVRSLYEERAMVEQSFENLFSVTIMVEMYNKNLEMLDKSAQILTSKLSGKKVGLSPLMFRQPEAFKSVSPFMTNEVEGYDRTMLTSSLSTTFPFYSVDVFDPNGTFLGKNRMSKTPVAIDFYDRDKLPNGNMFICGIPGSGKTYTASLIIMRSVLEGVKSVIIDPEGEYKPVTRAVNGDIIIISSTSKSRVNPFDITEEVEVDDQGNETGVKFVDVKGKAAEILNLLNVMFPELMTDEVKSATGEVITALYRNFNITEDPNSLKTTMEVVEDGVYKMVTRYVQMPRMSDLRQTLYYYGLNESKPNPMLCRLADALSIYCEGGIYDLFDCYTSEDIDLNNSPVSDFDLSQIDDDLLRPIAMHIVLTWTWNKFVKKDVKTKKRVVCDEAWLMTKKTMAGSSKTAFFLENCARRIRKYNGTLLTATQHFKEFQQSPEGEAVLSFSILKLFMKQSVEDIAALGDRFLMSDGEKSFLLTSGKGESLCKINKESFVMDIISVGEEDSYISKEYLKNM